MAPVDQHHFLGQVAQRPERCRYRLRRCLLKGCERPYWPRHPRSRYCSEGCRQAARRWQRWRAGQQYRAKSYGRERRRQQSRRYRQRCRERIRASADVAAVREGQRIASARPQFCGWPCARPGCYALFSRPYAHTCKRFCSLGCRLALRRVLDREARFRERRRRRYRRRLPQRVRPADTS
jgi:hypothetical protein